MISSASASSDGGGEEGGGEEGGGEEGGGEEGGGEEEQGGGEEEQGGGEEGGEVEDVGPPEPETETEADDGQQLPPPTPEMRGLFDIPTGNLDDPELQDLQDLERKQICQKDPFNPICPPQPTPSPVPCQNFGNIDGKKVCIDPPAGTTTTPTPIPIPTTTIKCPPGTKGSPSVGLFCFEPGSGQLVCPEGYTGQPTTNVGGSLMTGPKPKCTPITAAPPPTPTPNVCPPEFPNGAPGPCYKVYDSPKGLAILCQNGKEVLIPPFGQGFVPSCSGPTSPITQTPTPQAPTTATDDGIFTVQNLEGAITSTPDCPPESATVLLGPSTMENGGARILAAFDPCILTDGEVILNLPDEQGIQLVAANTVGGQTTQSVIVPMQRIAPITEGQTLYTVDLSRQITGTDPSTGNPVTLDGNVNSLFLLNDGRQEVELSGDNSVALNAILAR